jgi:hypothetical protein
MWGWAAAGSLPNPTNLSPSLPESNIAPLKWNTADLIDFIG